MRMQEQSDTLTTARARAARAAVLGCVLVISGCHSSGDARTGAAPREPRRVVPAARGTLELTGPGLGNPMTYTYDQLCGLELTRLENVLMQMSHAPDRRTDWRGPLLDALLAAAQIKPGPMYLTLEALDGYRLRCTRAELESAIVALQDGDGRWLAEVDKASPLRLVAPRMTANYWVRNLSRIVVEPAGESQGPR